ncbi:hypothetical protein E0485_00645 [Paenibacillus albiflavus]|uniref:DUF3224 domain-containing protein n=1 Tax=Paenibacillus albiflavus TaxID=2545760 RepID=A0A4R4EM19_9BACL|nr:hypothetical protein [Paenibacillus albiflavus]TCZ80837.1 hypothetical protein E0485_00645 [Paenibacillus albiflavus]
MDGTYNITMQTPMGMEKGTITFTQEGNALSGSLNIFRGSNVFSGGKVEGNEFEFSGEIKKLIAKIPYTAKGTIYGDNLTAVADTKYGKLAIKGSRA